MAESETGKLLKEVSQRLEEDIQERAVESAKMVTMVTRATQRRYVPFQSDVSSIFGVLRHPQYLPDRELMSDVCRNEIQEYVGGVFSMPTQHWTNEKVMSWIENPSANNITKEKLEITPTRSYRLRFCDAVCTSKMDKTGTKIVKCKKVLPARWIRVAPNDSIFRGKNSMTDLFARTLLTPGTEDSEQEHKPRLFPNHTTIPYLDGGKQRRVEQHLATSQQHIKLCYSRALDHFLPAVKPQPPSIKIRYSRNLGRFLPPKIPAAH